MKAKTGVVCGVAAGLVLVAAGVAGAAPKKDPAGTTLYMGQLRLFFASADANKDGYLEAPELARAFPGQGEAVLVQLDQDGDGRVSRDEFMAWAREYAKQLKKLADEQKKLQAAQQKLTGAKVGSKQYAGLQNTIKSQGAAIQAMQKEMKAFEKEVQKALEKELQKAQKKK
jgi:hypothetical protein